jgi:ABC-type branched-subunit amino acid transport system permease subunit
MRRSSNSSIRPLHPALSLNLLMMVIVGGAGFFFGPFLGAMIAVLLPEWLRFAKAIISSSTPCW